MFNKELKANSKIVLPGSNLSPITIGTFCGQDAMTVTYTGSAAGEGSAANRFMVGFAPSFLSEGSAAYRQERERFKAASALHRQIGISFGDIYLLPEYLEDEDGNSWCSLPYGENVRTLKDCIDDGNNSALSFSRIARVMDRIGEYHNNGYILMGLRPDNVFIAQTAFGTEEISISDRGMMIEKSVLHDEQKRKNYLVLYSKSYSAPELCEERFEDVTEKADVYSVGAILYNYITGKQPAWPGNISRSLREDLKGSQFIPDDENEELYEFIIDRVCRLMAPEPDLRPNDEEAAEMIEELGEALSLENNSAVNNLYSSGKHEFISRADGWDKCFSQRETLLNARQSFKKIKERLDRERERAAAEFEPKNDPERIRDLFHGDDACLGIVKNVLEHRRRSGSESLYSLIHMLALRLEGAEIEGGSEIANLLYEVYRFSQPTAEEDEVLLLAQMIPKSGVTKKTICRLLEMKGLEKAFVSLRQKGFLKEINGNGGQTKETAEPIVSEMIGSVFGTNRREAQKLFSEEACRLLETESNRSISSLPESDLVFLNALCGTDPNAERKHER